MKPGQRVQTKHGPGTIKVIERVSEKYPRAGVLLDNYPENYPKFTDNLLYYFFTEIELIRN
jgi:hypothetical protein